jgi:hypothetical protein
VTLWIFSDFALPWLFFSCVFNTLLIVLIFRLRVLSEGAPLTQSQRWGLSLLGCIYLTNTIQIVMNTLHTYYIATNGSLGSLLTYRFLEDFNQLSSMFLLLFGLVYPRPVLKWDRLKVILILVAILWTLIVVVQASVLKHASFHIFSSDLRLIEPFYWAACFIPIFLWLPQYERQNSPEMRMILTLMIWGYFLFHVGVVPSGVLITMAVAHAIGDADVWIMVLIVIVFVYLIRTMYLRLGAWGTAERANLFFIVASIFITIEYYGVRLVQSNPSGPGVTDPLIGSLFYLSTSGLWMIVRPSLFFYGLLRYQFFGPSVRADDAFALVLALLFAGSVFIIAFYALALVGLAVAALVGTIAAAVVFFVVRGHMGRLVDRLLPMSHGAASVSLAERRTTYAVGLQSAVVAGEVSDPDDAEVLKRLRKDLRVSDREHELLMSGFSGEKPPTEEQEVEEVYLFHRDGTLLGNVLREETRARVGKKDMMVTMFTAVREFSKDALKKGIDYVGAIDYGSTVLIIEIEGEIALGVILRGRDNPQVRQKMRDLLRKVDEGYSEPIRDMVKGKMEDVTSTKERLKGLEALLRGFLKG